MKFQVWVSMAILVNLATAQLTFSAGLIKEPSEKAQSIDREIEIRRTKLDTLSENDVLPKANLLREMCSIQLYASIDKLNLNHCEQYIELVANLVIASESETNIALSAHKKDLCRLASYNYVRGGEFVINGDRLGKLSPDYQRKLLETCQTNMVFAMANDTFTGESSFYLHRANTLFYILKEYSKASAFFKEIANDARSRISQVSSLDAQNLSHSWQFNSLVAAANFDYLSGNFDSALQLYLEADQIYLNSKGKGFFLSDSSPAGGYSSQVTLFRASSFATLRNNLATLKLKEGNLSDAENLLKNSIADFEQTAYGQLSNADSLALIEIASPLYTSLQNIYIERKDYVKALEVADRSRSLVFLRSLKGNRNIISPLGSISFDELQKLANEQKSTYIIYGIPDLPRYDYANFRTQENKLNIWVISPNGKLEFRSVDIASTLAQSSIEITNKLGSSSLLWIVVIISLFSTSVLIYIFRQKKLFTFVILTAGALVPVAFIVLGISSDSQTNSISKSRGNETNLTELTQATVSLLKTRGNAEQLNSKLACNLEDKCLQSLYLILIEPIKDLLPSDPEASVVFVPYRSIHSVPFSALKSPDGKYLIEKHTLSTVHSLQVLKFIHDSASNTARDSKNNQFLIVGNPIMPKLTFGLFGEPESIPQLPSAELEAKEIASLLSTTPLIGSDATVNNVVEKLFSSKYIHLATHGYLNFGQEGNSALAFTESKDEFGNTLKVLDVGIIEERRMLAEMVVLSACETGLGQETIEGNLGITRPFLVAGVPTVVSSLWSVPDASTSELMISFYKKLQNTSNKARALRQAMLETKTKFPEPLYWAGFTLTGLNEMPVTALSATNTVGQMGCANPYQSNELGGGAVDIVTADLESTASGFKMTLTLRGGNYGSPIVINFDDNLVVANARVYDDKYKMWGPWNLVAYDKTPWLISPDGKFEKRGMFIGSRTVCSFSGKVNFIGDSKIKLQGLLTR